MKIHIICSLHDKDYVDIVGVVNNSWFIFIWSYVSGLLETKQTRKTPNSYLVNRVKKNQILSTFSAKDMAYVIRLDGNNPRPWIRAYTHISVAVVGMKMRRTPRCLRCGDMSLVFSNVLWWTRTPCVRVYFHNSLVFRRHLLLQLQCLQGEKMRKEVRQHNIRCKTTF